MEQILGYEFNRSGEIPSFADTSHFSLTDKMKSAIVGVAPPANHDEDDLFKRESKFLKCLGNTSSFKFLRITATVESSSTPKPYRSIAKFGS